MNRFLPKILQYFASALVILVLSIPVILLLLPIQTSSSIAPGGSLTPAEITQAEQLILDMAPQSPRLPSTQEITINISEINILTRYLLELTNFSTDWDIRFSQSENLINAFSSWQLVSGWIPLYLNLRGEFKIQDNKFSLEGIQVGGLYLPKRLANLFLETMQNNFTKPNTVFTEITKIITNIRSINVEETEISAQVIWDPVLVGTISDKAQQFLISPEDRERIVNYYLSINEIITVIPTDTRAISLNALLNPLFESARKKSEQNENPIAENRTIFQTLAIYVNNENIENLVGEDLAKNLPHPKFIEVRLLRRQDLAQHLISMAAITASIGSDLAQLVSTTKEAYDARYRSGFSFSDLTANNVGVAMGSIATESIASAIEMQHRLANVQSESDYMPLIGNNRDGLTEPDFTSIYNDRSSLEYQKRLTEIQEMIKSRPLFQDL